MQVRLFGFGDGTVQVKLRPTLFVTPPIIGPATFDDALFNPLSVPCAMKQVCVVTLFAVKLVEAVPAGFRGV